MKLACRTLGLFALASSFFAGSAVAQDTHRLIAWNDLGMHCIDPDFSTFSILPPYNTINVQWVRNGVLVTNPLGFTVTYEAVADPAGSINTTSIGKTNFWDHVQDLFGVSLPLDMGLAGFTMPGSANTPQSAHFSNAWNWFQAEGVPLTPIDDSMADNAYPLFKWVARDQAGLEIASTVATVPASRELACSRCHASGTSASARPSLGWVYDADEMKDDRLNILRLHDEKQGGTASYQAALATAGFDPAGLESTVINQGKAILCARCHSSNALPGSGIAGLLPMTQVIHGKHAGVLDPMGESLGAAAGRASCYTCHPGDNTKCLRGAMGKAIGPDGDFSMDCQACHGDMNAVAAPTRQGWFEEPNCQSCHAGSATQNPGQIRYESAFDLAGLMRQPSTNLFATTPDVPAAGYSLYRFSTGHGGMQCSACHGPPHAIYPTSEVNDNQQSLAIQGHEGTIQDCSACHQSLTDSEQTRGPHGMHPTTADWVEDVHGDWVESNGSQSCQECHGADSKGTLLSEAKGDRSYNTDFGQMGFYRGFQVGCYTCHNGPDDDDDNPNRAPLVRSFDVQTPNDSPKGIALVAFDGDGDALDYRILSQPEHGTVGWSGATATYYPDQGYVGSDSFLYAVRDGQTQSARATVSVQVGPRACGSLSESFGFGCPSSTGEVPRLQMEGCAEPGSQVTLTIDRCPPNTWMFLLQGPDRQVRELWSGCVLRVESPFTGIIPLQSDANGRVTYDLDVPLAGNQSLVFQAWVFDANLSTRGTFSNGLEITLP